MGVGKDKSRNNRHFLGWVFVVRFTTFFRLVVVSNRRYAYELVGREENKYEILTES